MSSDPAVPEFQREPSSKSVQYSVVLFVAVLAFQTLPYADNAVLPSIGVPDAEGESDISNTCPDTVSKYNGSYPA